MKKLFAILLAIALLLPMGLVSQASAEGTGEVAKKGFYLANWTMPSEEIADGLTNVYYMIYFWSDKKQVAEGYAHVNATGVSGGTDIPTIAQKLKAKFDTYPDGARHIMLCLPHDAAHTLSEYCYFDKMVPVVSGWLDKFLAEYKRIGGKIDGIAVDIEFLNVYNNYITDNFYAKDNLAFQKMVEHPTYQEKIRPRLVERGFKFYDKISPQTPEIYSIHPNSGTQYAVSRAIWNRVLASYMNETVTESCAPLWKYYPDAALTDYRSANVKTWVKETTDDGGTVSAAGGNQTTLGNSSNENFYFLRPSNTFYIDQSTRGPIYKTIVTRTSAIYEESAFHKFLWDANLAKNIYLQSDDGKVSWWYAGYTYSNSSNSPFYAETVFHTAMLDPQIFLGYILPQDCKSGGQQDPEVYDDNLRVMDESLREVSRLCGYADRKPLNVAPNWNYNFALSGMYANGRNVWRLTPDTNMVSVEDFKVEGTDPTFKAGGQTITFPGGKIVETNDVYKIGTCGYWIETPADVYPVITREDNYYREYPAYGENFDAFELGTEYNYTNALPVACWEAKKQAGGTGTIVADPTNANNKVLELKNTYTLKNVNMPKNIIAGDTYAKHQAWEISFTLPSDLPADAEVVLLNYSDAKEKVKDGGVKISGGKVYYAQGKEYVEMTGVTLEAGKKYILIREMDFTNAEAFTSDYYIYAGETLVGKTKNVAIETLTLPVASISYGVKGVTGGGVLIDDYKLYATEYAADFYLYDADTGLAVENKDEARDGNTAYRLSWLNTTGTNKSFTIMAAYYEGGNLVEEKVIKEVVATPYENAVELGIVEKVEGKTVKVYLKDNNPAEEDDDVTGTPTDDTNKGGEKKSDNNMLIIIIAAAAAVVVVVVVIIIIAASSKKKKQAAAPATETLEIEETEAPAEATETTEEPKEE